MHPPPIGFALPFHSPRQHPICLNLHILNQTPLALAPAIHPLPNLRTNHIPHLPAQTLPLHNAPRRTLHQAQRRPDNPLDPVLRIRDVRFERDGRVPQAFWQRVHGVCDFVAFCVGRVGGRRQRLVVRELGVQADQQVVVVQAGEHKRVRR